MLENASVDFLQHLQVAQTRLFLGYLRYFCLCPPSHTCIDTFEKPLSFVVVHLFVNALLATCRVTAAERNCSYICAAAHCHRASWYRRTASVLPHVSLTSVHSPFPFV